MTKRFADNVANKAKYLNATTDIMPVVGTAKGAVSILSSGVFSVARNVGNSFTTVINQSDKDKAIITKAKKSGFIDDQTKTDLENKVEATKYLIHIRKEEEKQKKADKFEPLSENGREIQNDIIKDRQKKEKEKQEREKQVPTQAIVLTPKQLENLQIGLTGADTSNLPKNKTLQTGASFPIGTGGIVDEAISRGQEKLNQHMASKRKEAKKIQDEQNEENNNTAYSNLRNKIIKHGDNVTYKEIKCFVDLATKLEKANKLEKPYDDELKKTITTKVETEYERLKKKEQGWKGRVEEKEYREDKRNVKDFFNFLEKTGGFKSDKITKSYFNSRKTYQPQIDSSIVQDNLTPYDPPTREKTATQQQTQLGESVGPKILEDRANHNIINICLKINKDNPHFIDDLEDLAKIAGGIFLDKLLNHDKFIEIVENDENKLKWFLEKSKTLPNIDHLEHVESFKNKINAKISSLSESKQPEKTDSKNQEQDLFSVITNASKALQGFLNIVDNKQVVEKPKQVEKIISRASNNQNGGRGS